MTGPGGTPFGPGSRPGRRALFSGPYDPGLATGEGDAGAAPPADAGRSARRPVAPGRPAAEPPPAGRRAFFSDAGRPAETPAPGRPGEEVRAGLTTVVVECRTCLNRTPMSLPGLGLSLIPSLWLPSRPWPRLMRCPSCHRVSWCRIEWPRLRGSG